jgi:hypothetical protein
MAVRVTLDRAEIERLLHSRAGPVVRRVEAITVAVEAAAKQRAPVDEGILRASIDHAILVTRGRVIGRVGTGLKYGLYQHEGTGIYGPRGRVITPKRGRFLVFESKGAFGPLPRGARRPAPGGRQLVFARKVRGTPKNPFLLDALVDVSPFPVRRLR